MWEGRGVGVGRVLGKLFRKENFCFWKSMFAIGATSYRECLALRAQNAKKVGPECQKIFRKSQKSYEKVPRRDFFKTFSAFRHLFGTPGRQTRDDLFETFSALRARRVRQSL